MILGILWPFRWVVFLEERHKDTVGAELKRLQTDGGRKELTTERQGKETEDWGGKKIRKLGRKKERKKTEKSRWKERKSRRKGKLRRNRRREEGKRARDESE